MITTIALASAIGSIIAALACVGLYEEAKLAGQSPFLFIPLIIIFALYSILLAFCAGRIG